MTPVRVLGLHGAARGPGAVLFVETVARDRVLGFHIPASEAGRVARLLGLARCRHVPVYDLVDGVAASLGGRVSGAILDAQPEGICARLQLARTRAPAEVVEIPCHPADAVALALQARAPIHATAEAMARATPTDLRQESPAVASWLERVQPSDFAAISREGSG